MYSRCPNRLVRNSHNPTEKAANVLESLLKKNRVALKFFLWCSFYSKGNENWNYNEIFHHFIHFSPIRLPKTWFHHMLFWDYKVVWFLWWEICQYPSKLNIYIPFDPGNLSSRYTYTREITACTRVLYEALSVVAKAWKPHKCLSKGIWLVNYGKSIQWNIL